MKYLRTFQFVAEELNFSRAAIKLNYSQPTVSKHIQALEESLNVMLLNRKDGQYQLTEAGLKLYNHSLNIKKEMDAIEKLSLLGKESFELKLQGHDFYCYEYFIPAITKMRKIYPGVKFGIQATNNQDTVNNLLKNKIDVGIISGSILPKTFETIQIGAEDIGICVGKEIYRAGLTTQDYIQKYSVSIDESDFYQTANIFPYLNQAIDVVDTNSDEVVQQAVLNHRCVGVVRLGRLEENIKHGDVIVIETIVRKDPIYLAANKSKMNQTHIRAFFELLIKITDPRKDYQIDWR